MIDFLIVFGAMSVPVIIYLICAWEAGENEDNRF